ncbi:MAG: DUF1595 domain-containing protein [Vicinamibacterales bacterium]
MRIPVKAGRHELGVSFAENSAAATEGPSNRFGSNLMAIDRLVIEGPLTVTGISETPSRTRIFSCRPARPADEAACAEKIVSTLARRAYRRPVTPAEVQTLVGFYKSGRSDGGDFDTGIQFAIERLLVSPNFLLRVEKDPATAAAGTPYRISNLELASRLSFFLWSSIPDDELIDRGGSRSSEQHHRARPAGEADARGSESRPVDCQLRGAVALPAQSEEAHARPGALRRLH